MPLLQVVMQVLDDQRQSRVQRLACGGSDRPLHQAVGRRIDREHISRVGQLQLVVRRPRPRSRRIGQFIVFGVLHLCPILKRANLAAERNQAAALEPVCQVRLPEERRFQQPGAVVDKNFRGAGGRSYPDFFSADYTT